MRFLPAHPLAKVQQAVRAFPVGALLSFEKLFPFLHLLPNFKFEALIAGFVVLSPFGHVFLSDYMALELVRVFIPLAMAESG